MDESLTTDQLVNDQDFREAVEFFKCNGRMEEDQAREMLMKFCKMEPVRRKSCSCGKANYLLRTEPSYTKQKG